MKKVLIYFSFAVLVCIGCKDEPTPPEQLPEGYQQDIPWPSLCKSSWPKFAANAQGTNRSKYLGPQEGIIEWSNDNLFVTGGVSTDNSNGLFIASFNPRGLYKLDASAGEIAWKYDSLYNMVIDVHSSPIILYDQSIVASSGNTGHIIRCSPKGKILWAYDAKSEIYNQGIAMSKEGIILFIDRKSTLHAIDTLGQLKWKIQNPMFGYYGHESIVFSPDGKTIYFQGTNVGIIAFDLNSQQVKWTFGSERWLNQPIVDSQGHVYILSKYTEINQKAGLYSLNEDGSVRWYYEHNNPELGKKIAASLAMNSKGDIYFGYTDSLYCVNYFGKLRFKNGVGPSCPIIIDGNDNLYIIRNPTSTDLFKVDQNGNTIWVLKNLLEGFAISSTISNNNQLIVPEYQYKSNIISIK